MKRKKILFVCTGNTCRSPMAEVILRNEIKGRKIKWWDVASCGIHADVGGAISRNAYVALADLGLSPKPDFKPKQLTQKIIESSTLVITMTASQKAMLEGCGNVMCIKDFTGCDVVDPYGGDIDVYRLCLQDLMCAAELIIKNYILKCEEKT